MAVAVQTSVFEGPADLLLQLVSSGKVDLWEVAIGEVVDAFLLRLREQLDVGTTGSPLRPDLQDTTEFLLVAATLVELKVRRLLPEPDDPDIDEEFGRWEQRDLLLARLIECLTFRRAGAAIGDLVEGAARSHPRTVGLDDRFLDLTPDLLAGVTPDRLRDACRAALEPKPVPRVSLDHVAPVRQSVTEVVEHLARVLPGAGRTTFRSLVGSGDDRLDVVVRFLALLELFRLGMVDLHQGHTFGELVVTWLGTPS